jgi:hypothetical protein
MVGVRANGQNLDLNRDYMKAEAPETRASLAMFNRWDPDLFVDLHTTDGSYHGYSLTYAPPLNPAAPLAFFARDSLMPVLRQRMQSRHGFATFDYGDFISDDTLSKGWVTFSSQPRYGTNYYGLRGRVAILSEAFSHDPFEKRVKSTYAFVQEILSLAAQQGSSWKSKVGTVRSVPIRFQLAAAPDSQIVVAEIMERTGDSTRTQPGVPKGRRRTGKFIDVKMPVFERFKPTLTVDVPSAYVIPAADTQAVRILRYHGVRVDSNERAMQASAQVFHIDSTVVSTRPFQGHREMRLVGRWQQETRSIPAGSYSVSTSQPLGILAVYLLEPQSDDGLVTWNYFDRELQPGGTYPVLKLLQPQGTVQ